MRGRLRFPRHWCLPIFRNLLLLVLARPRWSFGKPIDAEGISDGSRRSRMRHLRKRVTVQLLSTPKAVADESGAESCDRLRGRLPWCVSNP